MDYKTEIILKGFWWYDDLIKKPIEIIKQNWDFYFEEGYDEDKPDLNDKGEVYYVIWDDYYDIRYANRSQSFLSIDEALQFIKENIKGKIVWKNLTGQK